MALNPAQMALLGGASGALGGFAGSMGGGMGMAGGITPLAYSNPYSAAAMAAGQAFSSMMGGAPPSNTSGVSGYRNDVGAATLDGSGWTVSTGSSKASAVPTMASATQAVAQTAMSAMQNPMLLLAAVAVVMVWHGHKG
ncbi:hypothetical protein [Paraburkholderia mimosarum]|uniref:hypothetical protein n=1 Tax=Paraburkholderia mimosarum TaxID=312026 RepID=UPI00041D3FA7|nr:hypothetical protein [Paraburkholderia mimosarum]